MAIIKKPDGGIVLDEREWDFPLDDVLEDEDEESSDKKEKVT